MEDLKGKKLLIVTSDGSDRALLKAARELGLYVICCDRYTDYRVSPTKAMADEAWDIDYTDTERVAEKCREAGVAGVIAAYGENRVEAACRISEAIGRPFYATVEQIDLTRNKILFKNMCEKHGIPTPHRYKLSIPLREEEVSEVRFPVIVKPSDNGGRKGISVCRNKEQLKEAVDKALAESIYKDVVVEEFLKGTEMSALYTMADGKISLSLLNDKYISEDEDSKGFLCSFVITPSRYLEQYCREVDPQIRALLKDIGAKNGVATFQMLVSEGRIYVFEMGYRINGNNDFIITEKENGLNSCHMLMHYSLTGSMGDDLKRDTPFFRKYYCTFVVLLHAGKITKLDVEELKGVKGIEDIYFTKQIGDVVSDRATNVHKSGMIKFSAETLSEVGQLVHFIQTHLHIEDENGKSMLFDEFDTARLEA